MKTLRGYSIVFILLWLLALIFTLPARTIVPLLPEDGRPAAASGTVWNGQFSELRWKNIALTYVTWRWEWYNGVPGLRIGARGTFGEGNGFVSWLGGWRLDDTRWLMSTTALQPLMAAAALPVEASGTLALRVEQLRMRNGVCSALAASITWRDASLALGGPPLRVGMPELALACQPEGIGFTLQQQQAPLRFSGRGRLSSNGDYNFHGETGQTAALPAPWRQWIENATRPTTDGREMEVSGKWMFLQAIGFQPGCWRLTPC